MLIDRRRFVEGCAVAGIASTLSFSGLAAAESAPVSLGRRRLGAAARLGSWHMASPGASPEAQAEDAMRLGISLGLTLIDTAEIYSSGERRRW